MKPGDLIEWIYDYNLSPADEREMLWSTVEKRYVPIGCELVHMLISYDDKTYSWLNRRGIFHASVHDTKVPMQVMGTSNVVPRVITKLYLCNLTLWCVMY